MQLLSSISYLAEKGYAHRDIKPENIFVKGNSCILGDYGLIKKLSNATLEDRNIFKESPGAGMPFHYRTPDLVKYAKNESDLTYKTDIYQLGLVLTELFTGQNPLRQSDDILGPIELRQFSWISSNHGGLIIQTLKNMLIEEPSQRSDHKEVADAFAGIFQKVVSEESASGSKLFS